MVEIAKCRCGAEGRLLTGPMYASVDCSGPSCWTGPIRTTGAEAIAAWNALMAPTPAPEPAVGMVRVRIPVRIAYAASSIGSWPFVLASDGTMWGMPDGMHDKGEWKQLPNLPEPTEIPAAVEASDD